MTAKTNINLDVALGRIESALKLVGGQRNLFTSEFVLNLCLDVRSDIVAAAEQEGIELHPMQVTDDPEIEGGTTVAPPDPEPSSGPPPVAVSPPTRDPA